MAGVSFTVNGRRVEVEAAAGERLLDTLRDRLGLTGAKEGCGVGECGACTVLMNGDAVNSCLVLTAQCEGADVVTVEGLGGGAAGLVGATGAIGVTGGGSKLSRLQQSFLDHGAVQCGFCTPGMLMAATALLMKNPRPTRAEIREALAGNLCRCTGYEQIVEAVEAAADEPR